MIGMQMRAQDDVDIIGLNTRRTQPFEKRRVELMKARQPGALLVVSGATIEQDGVAAGANQPGMIAGDQLVGSGM